MLYSKSTGGFYDRNIHTTIPTDAVEVTEKQYADLMRGQSEGKRIVANSSGHPMLADQPLMNAEELAVHRKASRANAYRAESDPLFFKAQRGEATMDEWFAKVAEIKARYPDPAA